MYPSCCIHRSKTASTYLALKLDVIRKIYGVPVPDELLLQTPSPQDQQERRGPVCLVSLSTCSVRDTLHCAHCKKNLDEIKCLGCLVTYHIYNRLEDACVHGSGSMSV